MALRNNTWKLNQWYDQNVAGNVSYSGSPAFYTWGDNEVGGLGQGNQPSDSHLSSPVQLSGTTWSTTLGKMAGGYRGASVIKTDGTLWVWGYNSYGELGLNNTTAPKSPVQVPGTTWATIDRGYEFSLATKTDGTLWAWGRNYHGQIGQSESGSSMPGGYYSSPKQIPGTTWKTTPRGINGHQNSSTAIRTDGTMWTWGMNQYVGALGQNNTTNYSSPKQIYGGGTDWDKCVKCLQHRSGAIKTDGTLWFWGTNSSGCLGLNDILSRSSPTQLPGTTWNVVCINTSSAVAVKTDGTLWVWGNNQNGNLGQNDTVNRSSPIQIPGTTWNDCNVGYEQTFATKTDGTMWGWGDNAVGELAQNNVTQYSSPIQIPGNWPIAATGGYDNTGTNMMGLKEL
jgi:alpha-tubulin suppressor-like RCC1 family protein